MPEHQDSDPSERNADRSESATNANDRKSRITFHTLAHLKADLEGTLPWELAKRREIKKRIKKAEEEFLQQEADDVSSKAKARSRIEFGKSMPGQNSVARSTLHSRFDVPRFDPIWQRGAAVLVGVSQYTLRELNRPSVANNVSRLSQLLNERFGVPVENIVPVENPDNPRIIHDAIERAASLAADAKGGLFFYYAGHGWTHERNLDLMLALSNSIPDRSWTQFPFDAIRGQIADTDTPVRLAILDSCYSGSAIQDLSEGDVAGAAAIEGSYVITSSGAFSGSGSPSGEKYTTFTGQLIRALSEGIPDGPDFLTANSLVRHLKRVCKPVPHSRSNMSATELPLMRNPWID
ncbi:caspase family protein [Streptomyces sp. NPDC088124]|uniref:caspase, EACC1-associated type n=1 Tax=Streptomyces sp. NPDC088124 TaxID=3154654 RepID=UPI00343D3F91